MNSLKNFLLLTIIFFVSFTQCSEVVIRPATSTDCDALKKISHQQYHNDFKPLWTKYYSPFIPSTQAIEDFVAEKEAINNATNSEYIKKQENEEDYKLIVAEISSSDTQKEIVGFCRFEKKDATTMYINFIIVDEQFRKKNIAKQLSHAALHCWNGVTTCNFRALAHYGFINELYSKHGCKQIGTIALDPQTGKVSTHPNAPITHYDYSFAIQKN